MHTVVDNGNGVKTHVALQDGSLVTGTSQDCTPILEDNAKLRSHGLTGSSEMRLAARVPFVVVEKYCNDKGITFREFSNSEAHKVSFLNDPDYKLLRVWEGRV